MKVNFQDTVWPRWTVKYVTHYNTQATYEFTPDGQCKTLISELFYTSDDVQDQFSREFSWEDEADRKLLCREAKELGVDLKSCEDLNEYIESLGDHYYALHGADSEGKSVMIFLHNLRDYDLNPEDEGVDPDEEPDENPEEDDDGNVDVEVETDHDDDVTVITLRLKRGEKSN